MVGRERRKRFGDRFLRFLTIARNPIAAAALLIIRQLKFSQQFRVGQLYLSARRGDLGAISEVAIEGEYGFVRDLAFPASALVMDMGANIGCFSALAFSLCPNAEIHAVEPSPDTFSLLSSNRARYPMLRWHLYQRAISDAPGVARFHNEGPSGSRRLTAGTSSGIEVRTETFDGLIGAIARDRQVFLCKMDIEGAEIPVFSGSLETLKQIEHFVIEIHGPAQNLDIIVARLSQTFPRVARVTGRTSSKPMIHAWRPRAHRASEAELATRQLEIAPV